MPRGMPSTRRQMRTICFRFGGVGLVAGPDSAGALKEEADGGVVEVSGCARRQVHAGQVEEVLVLEIEPGARGGHDFEAGRFGQEVGDQRAPSRRAQSCRG